MNNDLIYVLMYVFSVAVASISQILLKKSADKKYKNKINEYLNPLVIIAYIMFFGTTLLNIIALRYIYLSQGAVIESLGYVFVGILSFFILKEKFSKRKIFGTVLIIIGVIIFSI